MPRPTRPAARNDRVAGVLRTLERMGDPARLQGMARYGIATDRALGITVTELRALARKLGRDHDLALALWASGIHEARILATLVEDPARVTQAQMESWVRDVDSWDLCDGLCGNLFDRTAFAMDTAVAWSAREEEFTKRAGFALMAWITVHRKDVSDAQLERFLPLIHRQATDDRNYVKKAVNWALRTIGKRSLRLNAKAIATARRIQRLDSRSARWIAADALRELQSEPVRERLARASA